MGKPFGSTKITPGIFSAAKLLIENGANNTEVSKYLKVINLMKQVDNVQGLAKYGSLHYEKLRGDKEGLSSVRVDRKYRIEFE